MNTWLPIFTSLIAVFSVWLGSRLTRSKDERQWRRDRCLEAYADVLQACGVVINEAGKLYLGLADVEIQMPHLHEKHMELGHAINRTVLLSPDDMDMVCKTVSDCLGKIAVTAGKSPKVPVDEWMKLTTVEAAGVVGRFMAAARNDLHTPSLYERWSYRQAAITARILSKVQHLGRRLSLRRPSR